MSAGKSSRVGDASWFIKAPGQLQDGHDGSNCRLACADIASVLLTLLLRAIMVFVLVVLVKNTILPSWPPRPFILLN